MKSKSRRMMALLIALLMLLGMANAGLAKETYSKPVDLGDRIKHPADDNQADETPPKDDTDVPTDPESSENPEETGVSTEPTDPGIDDSKTTEILEEPVDSNEGNPEEDVTPDTPVDPGEGENDPEEAISTDEAADTGDDNQQDESETQEPIAGTVRTKDEDGRLNLRETPSVNGAIITTIPHGAALTVIRYEGEWAFVEYEGIQGYVSARYVSQAPQSEDEDILDEEQAVETPVDRKAEIHVDKDPSALYLGDEIAMRVVLHGFDGLDVSYQWQVRAGGAGGWSDIPGATGSSHTVRITADNTGSSWRAVVSVDE